MTVGQASLVLIAAAGWPALEADLPAGAVNTEYQVKLENGQEVFLQTVDGQRRPLPRVTIAALMVGGRILMQIGCSGEDGKARVKVVPSQQKLYFFDAAQRAAVEAVPQTSPVPDSEAPRPKEIFLWGPVVVSSRVVEVPGGEPVPDAWVYVPGRRPHFGRSDRRGRFELSLPPFYTAALHSYKAGYREAKIESQDLATREIPLRRALRLEGQVVGPGGSALEGALVRMSNADERWRLETTTGPDGRFVFDEVGEYSSCEILALFESRQSSPFSFDPRAQAGIPIRLEIPPASRLALRVVDEQERPIAGAEIFAYPADVQRELNLISKNLWRSFPGRIELGPSDAEGRVRSDRLTAGLYQLGVLAAGFAPKLQNGLRVGPAPGQPTAEEAPVEEVLVLQEAAVTRGVVVDEAGKAVEGAAIALVWPGPDQGFYRKDPPLALSDARGEFLVREWAAGQKALLRADKKGYVPAVLPEIEIGNDQRWLLQLKKAGSLRGRVFAADKKMLEAWVSLNAKENPMSPRSRPAIVFTEKDGSFVLEGLAPGPHDLMVRGVPGYQVYQDGPIEIEAGRQLEVEIELKKAAVVFGRVTRPGGEPAPGVRVQVHANAESYFSPYFSVESDALGQYRIIDAAPGNVTLEARTKGAQKPYTRKVEIVEGLNEIDLVLEKPALSISGQLQGPRGEPIAGAALRIVPGQLRATSRADGSVVFDGLDPGTYELRITKEGYFFPSEPLEIREEGPHHDFLWRLQEAGLAVEGELLGLAPSDFDYVEVYAFHPEDGTSRYGSLTQGRYRIENLAPGTWSLFAKMGNRVVTRELELAESDTLREEKLDFGGLGSFLAQVVDAGRPAGDVYYHFSVAATDLTIASGSSAEGRLEFWAPPGTYRLMLNLGGRIKLIAIEIASGEPTEQVIDLATP